jgi:hypothetical protein
MKGVDIRTFRFDFDLTFAALLMHPDGTIHHTYAGRDWTDPQSHLSVGAFVDVLQRGRLDHDVYAKNPRPPKRRKPLSVDQMPWMKRRPKQPDCYHCHNVNDAHFGEARARGTYKRRDAWTWPDPVQVGLRLDKAFQTLVAEVLKGSAAAKAGLRPGDRLRTIAGASVVTFGDVQRVLDASAAGAETIPVVYLRDGAVQTARLRLAKGWKEPTPLVFAWRSTKWPMSPKPGFGGQPLDSAQKAKLGIDKKFFAFRIGYLVTWGENAYTGRNAAKAGLRKGDVVVSVDGMTDLTSMHHFHAWFRLTQKPGSSVEIKVLRNGKPKTFKLPVLK